MKFVETSPNNYAGASGKGNMFFTQKLCVQSANTHRPPQSHTNTQPMLSFWSHHFSLPSTFKQDAHWRSMSGMACSHQNSFSQYIQTSKDTSIGRRGNLHLHWSPVVEIKNNKPCINSALWRAAECHFRLLHFCYVCVTKTYRELLIQNIIEVALKNTMIKNNFFYFLTLKSWKDTATVI